MTPDIPISLHAGGSTAGYTPLIVRQLGHRCWYTTFDHLAEDLTWYALSDGREYADFQGDVWSNTGWVGLRRFIRSAAPTTLTRIITGAGLVDVTQDPSLLPQDGTRLLHASLPEFGRPSFKDKAVMLFRSLKVDARALRAPYHVRKSLWNSLCHPFLRNMIFRIEENDQLEVALLVALGDSLGYSYAFECAPERPDVIFVSFFEQTFGDHTGIKDTQTISYSGKYVYECTTYVRHQHVATGPGKLVVDSDTRMTSRQ